MYKRKDVPWYSMGRSANCSAMTCPSRSVTWSSSGSRWTVTWSFAVLNPTEELELSGDTLTVEVRAAGSTAHEASSGSWPLGPTRTRSTSSRRAVIWSTAGPAWISIPLAVAREAVTRSSRTNPDFCWDSAVDFACVVAARNRIPSTTKTNCLTLGTQHLMGAKLTIAKRILDGVKHSETNAR